MSAVLRLRVDGHWKYWTGRVYSSGDPVVSEHISDAYHFADSSAALQCTDTHTALRNSPDWRVKTLRGRDADT